MCAKVSKQINALLRIKNDLDITSRRTLYNSFISSNLNYCSIVWMFMSCTNLNKLDKLNKRALRMIYDDTSSTYDELLSINNSLDIYKSCMKSLCVEMYRIRYGQSPTYIQSLFLPSEHNYVLRDNNTFKLPKFKSITYGYHSMSYIGAKVCCNLDLELKEAPSMQKFKCDVKKWLLNQTSREAFISAYF